MGFRFFKREEFLCPCCKENLVKDSLIMRLDEARSKYGGPMVITSGYRCLKHNKAVGGEDNSSHSTGEAADIKISSSTERFNMVKALVDAGFNRIGIGQSLVHADVSKKLPQNVIWVYTNK